MILKKIVPLCLLFISSLTKADHSELLVGWELWYPYQYHNKQGALIGLDIESFNAIAKQAQLTTHYIETPWKRHLQQIKSGGIDIAVGASYTDDRAEYAFFSKPYRIEKVNLFVKKGASNSILLNSLSDLSNSNYLIGVEGGYFYGDTYQELIKLPNFRDNISEVVDLEQNVTMLLDGHIDGLLVDPLTMKAFVEKYKMKNEFEIYPIEIYQDNIHIMISKKSGSKALLNKINQAITYLSENGTLAEILNQWRISTENTH